MTANCRWRAGGKSGCITTELTSRRAGTAMAENGGSPLPSRHGRACPGHLRCDGGGWMAGRRPAMTIGRRPCAARPLAPVRRHFHGSHRVHRGQKRQCCQALFCNLGALCGSAVNHCQPQLDPAVTGTHDTGQTTVWAPIFVVVPHFSTRSAQSGAQRARRRNLGDLRSRWPDIDHRASRIVGGGRCGHSTRRQSRSGGTIATGARLAVPTDRR